MAATRRKKLAVWKFASCDGCQLTVLDCEDELLAIADALDFRMFLEAGANEYVMKPFTKEVITEKLALLGVLP